jgi:hypothetical protein
VMPPRGEREARERGVHDLPSAVRAVETMDEEELASPRLSLGDLVCPRSPGVNVLPQPLQDVDRGVE